MHFKSKGGKKALILSMISTFGAYVFHPIKTAFPDGIMKTQQEQISMDA